MTFGRCLSFRGDCRPPWSPARFRVSGEGRLKTYVAGKFWHRSLCRRAAVAVAAFCALASPHAAAAPAPEQVEQALLRAASYFRKELSVEGSYVWIYAADLSKRRGEGETTETQGWVQPPGTPSVGQAFLAAYDATRNPYFLEGAVETARALAATQLESGGWWPRIEFDPKARQAWCYRVDGGCREGGAAEENRERNATVIDDDTTQSALRLLINVDSRLEGGDQLIHDAALYGLSKLIEAQYPNGAWPIRFDRKGEADAQSASLRARYPQEWSRTAVKITSHTFYATNDDIVRDAIWTLLLAHRIYGTEAYLRSAVRAGDFLLAAQMPAPQRGWAQTYDAELQPIWGRKFEPPAIASRETAGAMQALLDLYVATGERRFLSGASAAADWLRASQMPDGAWARFYELETNRPLFMNSRYELTYDADDTPRHYSFKGTYDIPWTLRVLDFVGAASRRDVLNGAGPEEIQLPPAKARDCLGAAAQRILDRLDERGRWLDGSRIRAGTFIRNFTALTGYLNALRGEPVSGGVQLPVASMISRAGILTRECGLPAPPSKPFD